MFQSKLRPIVYPQYEHGRLAGHLASAWGNADFDRPEFDFDAFVQGVAYHDWHYGVLDSLPIGAASQADWLAMTKRGVEYRFEDPQTDIVVKLHLRRLLRWQDSSVTSDLERRLEKRLSACLSGTEHSLALFEWADRITRFCDQVAFDFCFEAPGESAVPVLARRDSPEETPLRYVIDAPGLVGVHPWPFSEPEVSGVITAFRQDGYPERLIPQAVVYRIYPLGDKPTQE